jgi:hypothetical protein
MVFPPYGVMNNVFLAQLRQIPFAPGDFRGLPGLEGTVEQQWEQFFIKTLTIINRVLWPSFIKGEWKGESAQFMEDMTRADLLLLSAMQRAPRKLDEKFSAISVTHREQFEFEDEGTTVPFGSNYKQYDPSMEVRLSQQIPGVFRIGLLLKGSNVPGQFKRLLQRPRPYQVALMFGHEDFEHLSAKSAATPSTCSGHCLHGFLAVGAVIERFLLDGENVKWEHLQQYAVDIGDRRVMAGVHYPSDNLASWLIAMLLADRVYRRKEVKQKLWSAIQQSFVFQEITKLGQTSEGAVYLEALHEITKAAAEGTAFS